MKKILIFTAHYYPGFLSGGIAQTILNTTEWLGDDIDFFVVTQDRDLNSNKAYPGIKYGKWLVLGKSKVRYLAPKELSFYSLAKLINKFDFDVMHLNSCYDGVFTIKILILRRLGFINPKVVILSPRGEFVEGPLHIKFFKKKSFIILSKLAGFYKKVLWHSSVPLESKGIINEIGVADSEIKLAIDLPIQNPILPKFKKRSQEILKIFFISRLTREKNLDGALRILKAVKSRVIFDIIGPQEDPIYFKECEMLIKELPKNIAVRILGVISPKNKFKILSSYDLLLFPSHGENYGHVIAESISAGTRVLISQSTPWRNLSSDGVGWDINNSNTKAFVDVIEKLANQSAEMRDSTRQKIRNAAKKRLSDPNAIRQNLYLYTKV